MFSDRRSSCRVRHWSASAGLAAAAAAVIGMGTAHADDGSVPTDIGLLNTAQTDIAEAFSLAGHTNAYASFFPELEAIQTPLLSSDNSFFSGFGEALFNGPDQQLAQSSEAFLSAAEALSSATPGISELGVLGDYASTGFQVTDAIFGEIPSTLIGKLTDQIFDIGGFDTASASAATDLASSASSASDLTADAAGSPDAVLGQAVSDLSQGVSVLEAAPTADLSADQLNFFTSQETPITTLEPFLTQIGSLQDSLPSADQAFVLGADEQLVTAAQAVLSADQALVVADQAGDLGGTLNTFDIGVLDADLGLVSSYFTVIGDDIIAPLFTDFGIPLP
jgi:hypothetical protein